MREPASKQRSSRSSSSGLSFDFFIACFDLHQPLFTTSLTFSPLPSFPFPTFLPPTPSPPHSTTNNGQRPRRFHGGSPPRPRRRRGDHERRDGDERCCLFELVVLGVRCCLPCPRQAVWLARLGPRFCLRCVISDVICMTMRIERGREALERARESGPIESALPPTEKDAHPIESSTRR
jgi:hypothetical protein